MNNSLDDLAAEYRRAAELLTQMLLHGNEMLRAAREDGDKNRLLKLRSRQQDLYAQRTHVLQVARYLKNYYDKDDPCIE